MARPPKYEWDAIDRLLAAGKSIGEISTLTGVPANTIRKREARRKGRVWETSTSPQTAPRLVLSGGQSGGQTPDNCPSQQELQRIREQNEVTQWLDAIEQKTRDTAKLGRALQSRIARYLASNSELRACDIANVASALSTVDDLCRRSGDELGDAIVTLMKFDLLDKRECAYLAKAVMGDRDRLLDELRNILRGDR